MDNENIKQEILNIAAEIFEVDLNILHLESSSTNVEQWDSLSHLRLFMEIQSTFDITFTTNQIQSLSCLKDIYHAVLVKLNKQI